MIDTANPALLGAMIGAVLGLIDYVIIMTFMGRIMSSEAADPEAGPPTEAGRAKMRQSLRLIKPAVMIGSFVVFPVVGYFIGRQFAP